MKALNSVRLFHEQSLGLPIPTRVDIVALGATCADWVKYCLGKGQSSPRPTQVWTVNRGMRPFAHDLAFVMDDLVGEAATDPDYGRALMRADGQPIITSTAYPMFPRAHTYPLYEVIELTRGERAHRYLHNSIPLALAYACALRVETVGLWGCDYLSPANQRLEYGLDSFPGDIHRDQGMPVIIFQGD